MVDALSEQTFYRWKKQYGDLEPSQVRELKQVTEENARLKKIYAEERLKAEILKETMAKKW